MTLLGASVASLTALLTALAQGVTLLDPVYTVAFAGLLSVTAFVGLGASRAVSDPLGLLRSDFDDLVAIDDGTGGLVSLFYRSSVLVGIVVGLSFIVSPISPIALFEAESSATHLMRQNLGINIVFLLAPVQAALFRATKNGTLTDPALRVLNVITGLCCGLLVCDGRKQVNQGTYEFANLVPGTEFYDAVNAQLGDPDAVGRASTNTTAAFSVGLVVALFYLIQAARSAPVAER